MRVKEEITTIRSCGYTVWFDDAIRPTEEWPEEIGRALQACSLLIVFLTRSSRDSRNVRNEVHFALEEAKPILAIYLEEIDLPLGLRLRIGDIQAIHKTKHTPDRYLRLLSQTLAATLGTHKQPIVQRRNRRRDEPPGDLDLGQLGL